MIQSGLACIWATKAGIANQSIQLIQTQSTKLLKSDPSVRPAEKIAKSFEIMLQILMRKSRSSHQREQETLRM